MPGVEIISSRVFRGPNIWNYRQVICLTVNIGEYEEKPTDKIPNFTRRLLKHVPSLREHQCSHRKPGGFVLRLKEGTWLGHVIEHVAIELQCLAGTQVSFGKCRGTDKPGEYNVIFEYEDENVGIAAGNLAIDLINGILEKPRFPIEERLESLIRLAKQRALGPSTKSIVEAARRAGIPVLRLNDLSLVQLGMGRNRKRVEATISHFTSAIAVDVAKDKRLTYQILDGAGLPTPRGRLVDTFEEALDEAKYLGYPVVTKPVDASQGRGVVVNIQNDEELKTAFEISHRYSRDVIVQKYIRGRDFRVLVIEDEVVAVAERIPAHVIGDGANTIQELINITNADLRRGIGHEKSLTRIVVDDLTQELLQQQNLTLESIPEKGQHIRLKSTANLSTGGTAIDRTHEISRENELLAKRAARLVGLDIAGIDIIAEDISRPITEIGGAIVEVNAAPGFRMHLDPTEGTPQNVGEAVINMLFPPGTPSRIPIISITGTNGKTTTARMVAHILKLAGKVVGLTTTDAIYIDGREIMHGDCTGPKSAIIVLTDPLVEVAVLETARGGILREGLGFDVCDVGVIANVSADHLGLSDVNTVEEMADVKGLIFETVRSNGYGVVNVDDPSVYNIRRRIIGRSIYVSMQPKNKKLLQEHRELGGIAVTEDQGSLVVWDGRRSIPVVRPERIPATFNNTARHNVQNALFAVAACYALGITIDDIRQGLLTFDTSYFQTPGRLNIFTIADFRVILDYAHNAEAYRAIGDFAQRIRTTRVIGVIAVPGDRLDKYIREIGTIAGKSFDYIIIKEDADLRGRQEGEVANILKAGILKTGFPEINLEYQRHEVDAINRAIDLGQRDDVIVILVDEIQKSYEAVMIRRRQGR